MIEKYKPQLLNNWGDKADALECYCEVKFIDEYSSWSCYIYAMDPSDEDTIACIIEGPWVELATWSLRELYWTYNSIGDHPVIDTEFRRIKAANLYEHLKYKAI